MDDAIHAARQQLRSHDYRARVHALYLLGRRGDREALPRIMELVRDGDYRVRTGALEALAQLEAREAMPLILDALRDREMPVRGAAVAALGALRDRDTVEPLIAALSDLSDDVREAAINALAKIGDPRMRDPLVRMLSTGQSYSVRLAALTVLTDRADHAIVDVLIGVLSDEDDDLRGTAALALATHGDERALPTLEYMAAHDTGEHWVPADGAVHANTVTAERAIDAIIARKEGAERGDVEQVAPRVAHWRHRMKDYTGCRKTFIHYRRRSQADPEIPFPDENDPEGLVDRIELHFYGPRESHRGHLGAITGESFRRSNPPPSVIDHPIPTLNIPWQAWGALAHCGDLFIRASPANRPTIQPYEFAALLVELGFEDHTPVGE